jgi:hypothetical protein
MRGVLFFLLAFLSARISIAQNVGIGTTTPNASAMLEINSSNKGLLLPRVADTSAINNPVKGLMIYGNSSNKLWYYDGSRWQQNAANAGGMDSIWFKTKDTIAYTAKEYVGINTDLSLIAPQANLQVSGSLLVQGKFDYSNTTPAGAQTYTMTTPASTISVPGSDSVFRIYDPSGTGSYGSNMGGNILINVASNHGLKVSSVAAHFGFGTGDTLWISETNYPECRTNYTYRFTNTTVNPGDFILRSTDKNFIFRSNADGSNGKGFNFVVTRLYVIASDKTVQTAGPSLYFNASNSSFSAGLSTKADKNGAVAMGGWTSAIGNYSVALGYNSTASSAGSVAIGSNVEASGGTSVAMGYGSQATNNSISLGYGNLASGYLSTAMGYISGATGYASTAIGNSVNAGGGSATALGYSTFADGDASTAMGQFTQAGGANSTAMGNSTSASGENSTAMGMSTSARGYANTVVGMYNDPILFSPLTSPSPGMPLFIVGNGNTNSDRSNALVVFKNGNTGIGTNFPDEKLNVEGNVTMNSESGTTLQLKAAGVQKGFVQLSGDNIRIGTNSTNDNGNVVFRLNGADRMTILPNGNATLTGTLTQNSDARFKTDIRRIDHALETVMQLNGYRYHWKPELKRDNSMQVGLIAQNIETVLPELVTTDKEGNKSVAYQNMVAVLIEAVKEQQQQINELKLQVAALQKR